MVSAVHSYFVALIFAYSVLISENPEASTFTLSSSILNTQRGPGALGENAEIAMKASAEQPHCVICKRQHEASSHQCPVYKKDQHFEFRVKHRTDYKLAKNAVLPDVSVPKLMKDIGQPQHLNDGLLSSKPREAVGVKIDPQSQWHIPFLRNIAS